MNETEKPDDDELTSVVAEIADEFLQRLQRGETPDVEEYAQRFPDMADVLREALSALELIGTAPAEMGLPGGPADATDAVSDASASGGGRLGDFRILREIGRGGMGVVYEAEQISLDRRVALKVLPFAAMLDDRQLRRFKNEAKAAGQLHHTNIVPVFSVGCERGVHYYAMQYVEGQPLSNVIRELRAFSGLGPAGRDSASEAASRLAEDLTAGRLAPPRPTPEGGPSAAGLSASDTSASVVGVVASEGSTRSPAYFRSVARLCIQAAEALEHAHGHAIVHRDIKPSNLLLDAEGRLWVTDFGLAQFRPEPGRTLTMPGDLLGTLRYMSPEQARGGGVVIDHRADIYSLGVTLYELLTLEPAFDAVDRNQLLRKIAETDPHPPRRLNDAIPSDLATIVLKAVAKEPAARYATAQEFADDLERFLEHKPIRAKRPSLLERASKWANRHRSVVWSGVVLLVLALAVLSISIVLIARERSEVRLQRDRADIQRKRAVRLRRVAETQRALAQHSELTARRHLYAAHMNLAQRAWSHGRIERVLELLYAYMPEPDREDLRRFEWYYLWRLCHRSRLILRPGGTDVAFSPDGRTLAATAWDSNVRLWDPRTGRLLATMSGHSQMTWSVAFSPDGKTIASGTFVLNQPGEVILWDVATRKPRARLEGHSCGILDIAFSPDGKTLATAGGDWDLKQKVGAVKLWESATGRELASLTGHTRGVASVAFAPDGRTLASAGFDGTVRLWDAGSGEERACVREYKGGRTLVVAFSPDGKLLATGGEGGNQLKLWDPATLKVRATLQLPEKIGLFSVTFSPDGRILAAASPDTTIRLWDVNTGQEPNVLRGHTHWVWSVAFAPDGKTLASGSRDGTVRIWDLPDALDTECVKVDARWRGRGRFAFSPDGKTLAIPGHDGAIRLWDALTRKERASLKASACPINAVAFSPDGKTLAAAGGSDGHPDEVTLWNPDTGQRTGRLGPPRAYTHVAFSPDGRTLAVGFGKSIQLWDIATRRRKGPARSGPTSLTCLTVSPDGRTVAIGRMHRGPQPYANGRVQLWDMATMEVKASFHWPEIFDVLCVAFSPDGKTLVAGGGSGFNPLGAGAVAVVDLRASGRQRALKGHLNFVNAATFSPDGTTLATASRDGTVKLWDTTIWQQRASFKWERGLDSLVFSPDGATLLAGDVHGHLLFWQATTKQKVADGAQEIASWKLQKLYRQLYSRALAHAATGHWEKAAAEFSKAAELMPEVAVVAYYHALTRLGAADIEGYRCACAAMLKRFGCTEDPQAANWTAWTCALAPKAVADPSQPMRLVEKTVASKATEDFYLNTLGAALYRAGRLNEAVKRLTALTAAREKAGKRPTLSPACAWFFLAMAHHRLGHPAEAREYLREAVKRAAYEMREEPRWNRLVTLTILRREAEALIGVTDTRPSDGTQPASGPAPRR